MIGVRQKILTNTNIRKRVNNIFGWTGKGKKEKTEKSGGLYILNAYDGDRKGYVSKNENDRCL